MTTDETVRAFVAVLRGWSSERLKLLLVAIETEVRERQQTGAHGGSREEPPMERWWREGGVLFKDE